MDAQGWADSEHKSFMRVDSIFWIASMSKPITATAVLMLMEEGKLSLDDPIAKYVPELAGLKTADGKTPRITLRHLLTHTSGMGEATDEEAKAARTLSDLISQSSSITDTDISNAFTTGLAMMSPYAAGPLQEKISQVYVDPVTTTGKVKWSRASGTGIAPHACNEVVPVPPALLVPGTYLIFSEVWYDFVPAFGFDINLKFVAPTFHLSDQMFTRPRQSLSVAYPTAAVCN